MTRASVPARGASDSAGPLDPVRSGTTGALPAAGTGGRDGCGGPGAWVLVAGAGDARVVTDPREALQALRVKEGPITWIHAGLDDPGFLQVLQDFGLPDLAVDSLIGGPERPRVEEYQNCLYISLFCAVPGKDFPILEDIRVLLGDDWIVSMGPIDSGAYLKLCSRVQRQVFDLKRGVGYLLYYLVEWAVESLNPYLDELDDRVDGLEDQVVRAPLDTTREQLFRLKRELLNLRRSIAPLRDVMQRLSSHGMSFIEEGVGVYFRDVHDDVLYDIELLDTHRDLLTSALDLYLSTISNKLSAVMKQLAIVATIFMPLTFVTGFFGQNFFMMPFKSWFWFVFMLVSVFGSAIGMMVYFKVKSWL